MLKEKLKKLKDSIIIKEGKDNKKSIENLVVFLIILIITVIAINVIWNKKDDDKTNEENTYKQLATTNNTYSNKSQEEISDLEKNLENILSKINGVGETKVLITYSESSQLVALYNENIKESSTQETDTNRRNKKN